MRNKKFLTIGLVALLVIVVGGVSIWFVRNHTSQQATSSSPTETATLVAKVGALMHLPTNETPSIATVADVKKLAGQPFFAKAKNGFKVLIYPKAKKAILYDPFSNKIIMVAVISVSSSTNKQSPTPTLTKTPIQTSSPTSTVTPKPTH